MLSISPNKVLNPPGHNSTRKSKSLIDHIISTQVLKLFEHDLVYYDDISDHDAPFCNPQISHDWHYQQLHQNLERHNLQNVMVEIFNKEQPMEQIFDVKVHELTRRRSLAHSLILSRINYCNVLLSDAPQYPLKKLQKIQTRLPVLFMVDKWMEMM